MSKATQAGQAHAITWMNENPRSEWGAAIRPGTLGADEALINAFGVNEAARILGVTRAYVNGELTKKAYEAFRSYAKTWAATVEDALKSSHATIRSNRLTSEQLAALRVFANANGRLWKSALNTAWSTGRYNDYNGAEEYGLLQQIRNTFGPSWLHRFSFANSKTHSRR
jgi:hypothetical protein